MLNQTPQRRSDPHQVAVELSAVIVAATRSDTRVLTVRTTHERRPALPSGPLEPQHRTLEAGLRGWVEAQTCQALGYVEQLYTFGDRNRALLGSGARALSVVYLALVREIAPIGIDGAEWRDWYRHLPWEDWRGGRPPVLTRIEAILADWIAASRDDRQGRQQRVQHAFGTADEPWNEERVLERYELLYEVGLVQEAHETAAAPWASFESVLHEAEPMAADHRRILATAIARLRGKIKYRPLVFELMPPTFTLLQLQQTVEGLAGLRLHKPNFRRLIEQQGLVEETGERAQETGGRPARLWRFRPEFRELRPDAARLPRSPHGTA